MQLIRINEASESSSCATCVLKVILTGLMTNSSKLSRFLSFYSTKKISQNKGRFSNELRFCGYCRAFTCSSKRGDWTPNESFRVIFVHFLSGFRRFLQVCQGYRYCTNARSSISAFAKVRLTIYHYVVKKSYKIHVF